MDANTYMYKKSTKFAKFHFYFKMSLPLHPPPNFPPMLYISRLPVYISDRPMLDYNRKSVGLDSRTDDQAQS